METVGRLRDDQAAWAVENLRSHFFATMRGQAMEEDRFRPGARSARS